MKYKRRTIGYGSSDLWKGLAAGFVGGLIASWTINRFQNIWSKLAGSIEALPHNEFGDIWDGLAEGLGESFEVQASKRVMTPEVLAEV